MKRLVYLIAAGGLLAAIPLAWRSVPASGRNAKTKNRRTIAWISRG